MTDERSNIQLPGGIVAVGVTKKEADLLQSRVVFVERYCREKGWDMLNLTIDQLLEVRAQPGWQNPE